MTTETDAIVTEPPASGAQAPAALPRHWRTDLIRFVGVIALMAALMALGYFLLGPLKQLGPPQRCWENREIDGKLYKFNPCTGQFKLIGDVLPVEGEK